MTNKILVLVCSILIILFIFIPQEKNLNIENEKEPLTIKVLFTSDNNVKELDLEEYIIGVVAAEMPASFNMEALKAQAIAARTYAVYKMTENNNYDVITDTSNQGYITTTEMQEKWLEKYEYYYNKIKNAVQETSNLILENNGQAICAYYFSISNGYTEESESVFGQNLDYISSVESSWDKNISSYEKKAEISKSDFCQSLNINCTNINISNIKRNNTNHVITIEINNKTYKGTEFRKLLNLRSTDFDITITDVINITTRGYGHDVGMSQYGANEMAKNGFTYDEILKYYYQNINISSI